MFLWPLKINKKFSINNRIYDSIPVMFVSSILRRVGGVMWLFGLVGSVVEMYIVATQNSTNNIISISAIVLVLLPFRSIFILAGEEFEKETDSNKIYAYLASITTLVSCIVSIIAMLGI